MLDPGRGYADLAATRRRTAESTASTSWYWHEVLIIHHSCALHLVLCVDWFRVEWCGEKGDELSREAVVTIGW